MKGTATRGETAFVPRQISGDERRRVDRAVERLGSVGRAAQARHLASLPAETRRRGR